jgi:hypothetical protein
LTFTTSGATSVDYSGSALRYGLIDIKPIEIVETVKRFGLKFKRVVRTFESVKPPGSYAELVTFQNEAVFGTIEIPKWFDADKLIKAFSQRSTESYERDVEFKKAIEDVKKAERKGRPLLLFIQFAKNRFESERDYYLEVEAQRFLRSNFPLSFYNKLVVFDNTFYDFVKILEDKVRIGEFYASCARNFEMYRKKIAEMQRIISPIIDQMDKCFFSYSRLKKYVLVWNAKDYKEIFNPKFLDVKNLDFSEFEKQCNDYNMRLRETREFLLRYNSEILHKELVSKESTANMFAKLVMLPSSLKKLEG